MNWEIGLRLLVKNLKVGDRVTMAPMWKHRYARGEVIKITKEYIVVADVSTWLSVL